MSRQVRAVLLGSGLVAAHFLALRLLPSGSQAATNVSVGMLILAALLAALSAARTARRSAGRSRAGWTALAVGMVGWAFGESVWAFYVTFREGHAPFPNLGDAGFLIMVPGAVAGMVAVLGVRRGLLRVMLDGLLIAGSLLFLSWVFVLEGVYRAGNLTVAAKAVSLAYPLSDVLLAAVALILLPRAARGQRTTAALMLAAAVALSIGDLGFAYLNQHGTYNCGDPIDTGWVAGFVLIALAAHRVPSGRAERGQSVPFLPGLPYVPLTGAVLAAVALLARGERLTIFPAVLLGTVILLVLVRQMAALRDNTTLSRDLQRVVAQLHHLAYHDPLTGLGNRALFVERAQEAFDGPLALLYLDLDGFKPVNDRYGHAAGDALLVEVGALLRAETRDADLVARLGGDEFVVLMPGVTSRAEAGEVGARIEARLARPFTILGHRVVVGASVGVGVREPGDVSIDALLRRADALMYTAKSARRGRRVTDVPVGSSH
ncbi:GGDEF domain-containing protein [Dactylosporangium matsuzakiense]|uniref:GGDEF domain-containing protein n=1 Tax=Dactylosporangium matsuzakiense TaxID=53360 RepID=UPI0021C29F81|nr:GGDEF domain-containing protein [Dactylosporangium matsuzakiense]UWZ41318.1 GGDEF domain-containing protein [Dactylosporangium matsuzakiense]